MTTLELVGLYRAKGWDFQHSSWQSGSKSFQQWIYRSPRMNQNGQLSAEFTEEELAREEAAFYVRQLYGASLAIQFNEVQSKILVDLTKQQLLIDGGKVGAEMPTELTLNALKLTLQLNPS